MSDLTYVEIVWHDAHALTDSWIELDDLDDEPCVVVSVGVLLPSVKKGHVVVSQSANTQEQFDCVLAVPVGMIKSMRVLGVGGLAAS
jgi:hypothetical protein